MKILVAIAYYGTANEAHVRRLIEEYRSMRFDVDVVVLTEAWKDLPGVELRIGLPTPNPYSLPFAHKQLFVERVDDYDLFVYSEDDTLITEQSIDSFLWATDVLPPSTIAGFLRTEEAADGSLRCSSVNSRFHWRPDSAFEAGGEVFAEYTNPHAAAFLLTGDQLRTAIASGGFEMPVREGRLDMRVTAATDPYVTCGWTKVVCVSRLDRFLLPHLTNRYAESAIGTSLEEFCDQAAAVCGTLTGEVSSDRLFDPTSRLDDPRWDKLFDEPADPGALAALPGRASEILSIGVGAGLAEAPLVERGVAVHGIPLDEIVAVSARHRGVHTTAPDLRTAIDSLDGVPIDAVLAQRTLHHFPDPVDVLREVRSAVRPATPIVATFPNLRRETVRWLLGRAERPPQGTDAADAGVHLADPGEIAGWFRGAGYEDVDVSYPSADRAPALLAPITAPTVQITARTGAVPAGRVHHSADRPLVSVGLPVYDGENYLEHALRSIVEQDLDDWELVICDNASTDRTEEICRDVASSDPRIVYHRQERNIGAARNYNECFRRSRGRYFTWLAHDDVRAPAFLSRCVEAFEAADGSAVLVYPRADFIDEEGIPRAHDTYGVESRASAPWTRFGIAVRDTGPVNPVFGLARAAALEQTRLIGSFVASDRVLLAELALLGEIHEIPDVLSFRRLHARMSTNANPGKRDRTKWFDPDARVSPLGERQQLAVEFGRSVLTLPLSPTERLACLVTIPVQMGARHGRIALGRWRRQLVEGRQRSLMPRLART